MIALGRGCAVIRREAPQVLAFGRRHQYFLGPFY